MLTTILIIIYTILFIAYSAMGIMYTIEEIKTFNLTTIPMYEKIAMIIMLLIIWPIMKYGDNCFL